MYLYGEDQLVARDSIEQALLARTPSHTACYCHYQLKVDSALFNDTQSLLSALLNSIEFCAAHTQYQLHYNHAYPTVKHIHELATRLQPLADAQNAQHNRFVFIVESAMAMDRIQKHLLAQFIRIAEVLKRAHVLIVLMDNHFPGDEAMYHITKGKYESMILVHFPQYNEQEICQILFNECFCSDEELIYSAELFNNFLDEDLIRSLISSSVANLYVFTRDLDDHRHGFVRLQKYLESVLMTDNSNQGKKVITPAMIANGLRYCAKTFHDPLLEAEYEFGTEDPDHIRDPFKLELPLVSKLILLAGYIGSYVHSENDKRLFSTEKAARQRKKAITQGAKRLHLQLTGPQWVSIERLLIIFKSISMSCLGSEDNSSFATLYSQIASLISMNFFLRKVPNQKGLSGLKEFSSHQLKCLIPYQLAKKISKTLRFDIDPYLNDG
jgi:hypothetical protein